MITIGIDFGTSTTVVRCKDEHGHIFSVQDSDGVQDIINSAIFYQDDQQPFFGKEALTRAKGGNNGHLVTNFKMGLLEKNEELQQTYRQQIIDFLSYIHKRFEVKATSLGLNCDPDNMEVYVSYPAKWSDSYIQFMKEVIRAAGFNCSIYGVNEPLAATYAMVNTYLNSSQISKLFRDNQYRYVFMLDMGAGTTDIIIFRIQISSDGSIKIDQQFTYPSIDNPRLCGGREIDSLLSKHILHFLRKRTGLLEEQLSDDFFDEDAAKYWKDQIVSPGLQDNSLLGFPPEIKKVLTFLPNGREADKSFELSRFSFEKITEEHWRDLYSLISRAINIYHERFGIGAEDIDLLFLTGGHSQWYVVPKLFDGSGVCGTIGCGDKALNFEKLKAQQWRLLLDALPHECVALGLCMQNERIEVTPSATNGVWMQLVVNDKMSEKQQIIKVLDLLPNSKEVEMHIPELVEGSWDKEKEDDLRGYLYVYTGESLETAKCRKKKISVNVSLWSFFLPGDYDISCYCKVNMSEEGTLDILGRIIVNKDNQLVSIKYIDFNTTDLIEDE